MPPASAMAELQRELADLRAERDAALAREAAAFAAMTARETTYDERLAHQAATNAVLQAMTASPGDPQPVFDLITNHSLQLCNGMLTGLFVLQDGLVYLRSLAATEDMNLDAFIGLFPMAPSTASTAARAILEKRIIHVRNVASDGDLNPVIRRQPWQSALTVPIMRDGEALGSISLGAAQVGGFTDAQVELVRTFAEQAAIAVASAETYRALEERTADLQESLEYQTATSDVLKVISRSAFDLQRVLAAVAETAARLCTADQAAIFSRDGDILRLMTTCGFPPEYESKLREDGVIPPLSSRPPLASHRAINEGHAVHIQDAAAVPGYPDPPLELGRQRTTLGVPLLRDGEPMGAIVLARRRVEPFGDRQIELVTTFADQAVIAMENARLLNEQREALERQTAMAEVMEVINRSPGNIDPVFDVILRKVMALCGVALGSFHTWDGERTRIVATRGFPKAFADYAASRGPLPPTPIVSRILASRSPEQVLDLLDSPGYHSGHSDTRAVTRLAGARTFLGVPLVKEETSVGYFGVFRREVQAFSPKEVAVLEGFAAQAVVAMENARLLNEQREALEQQTAMAEVLQSINASPGDLKPVFDSILEKILGLADARFGWAQTFDGNAFHLVTAWEIPQGLEAFGRAGPLVPTTGTALHRLTEGEDLIQIADLKDTDGYRAGIPSRVVVVDQGGARTVVWVPLRQGTVLLGVITIYRTEVRPFTERQLDLIRTFAAQAEIAIVNARLLTEQREALEQQTATAEILQTINASPGDLAPVFDIILSKAHTLCGASLGNLLAFDGELVHTLALHGASDDIVALAAQPYEPGPAMRALIAGERLRHIPDIAAHGIREGQPEIWRAMVRWLDGRGTYLVVP
ncbi:MAG: GAF domain-containing protein, partial [Proteobacteria bacterium]|nr:GAF domain-containing protein [Pseudomonadota bacterium]